MAITERKMTLEEFLQLPEEEPALEYDDGVVTQKVSPQGKHGRLQMQLGMRLALFSEPRKLAMVFTELRTTFGGASPVPDIAVYRWDRVPLDPDGRVANRFTEPPDIAIEIVSPDQRLTPLFRKCVRFVERGVRIALILNPEDESAFRFDPNGVQALRDSDLIDLSEVLPGFEVTVQQVFDLLRPNKTAEGSPEASA